jgi:hypothetical protein
LILECARRPSTFLSCAFREQEDDQAAHPFLPPGCSEQRVFSNFGMRLFRYTKNRHDEGGPISIVTAVVCSMLLLTLTGKIDVWGEVMPPPMSG